ncbi:MAG: DNA polymerase III subunit gamma/tau [Pseudomonadota bacterium]
MSYQVLARKWRPRDFEGLVGQQHVVQALSNGLDQGRLHHAFLFTGTRGVGKTTIARILAKSLNCMEGVSSKPCNTCEHCIAIDQGRFVDLLEIDAASRTKVDDTREILDNVQYAPAQGRFKVYLIDEVHMLSTHSFNALLKTLEEPPDHVKFVLATTDPQKIPVTILSRCMQFNLRRLSVQEISGQIEHILDQESIPYETAAVAALARAADGSMRDGLSLLDQALAAGSGQLQSDAVDGMLGTVEQRHIHDVVQALIAQDVAAALAVVEQVFNLARDLSTLLSDLAEALHRIALIQQVPDYRDDTREDWNQLLAYAGQLDPEDLQLFYQIVVTGRRDLSLAPSPRSGTEMTILRLFAFRPLDVGTGSSDEPSDATYTLADRTPDQQNEVRDQSASQPAAKPAKATSTENGPKRETEVPAHPSPAEWPQFLEGLSLNQAVRTVAGMLALSSADEQAFEFEADADDVSLMTDRFKSSLASALSDRLGSARRVVIRAAGAADLVTPARIEQQARSQHQLDAESSVATDPVVRKLVDTFDAEVLSDTIRPTGSS